MQSIVFSYTLVFSHFILSLGKSTVVRNMSFVWAILTWVIAPILIFFFNFVGMSLANLLVSISGFWLYFRLRQDVQFSIGKNVAPFIFSAAVSTSATYYLVRFLDVSLANLMISLIVGGLIYLVIIFILSKNLLLSTLRFFNIFRF